jgi:hypothetical protein
METPCRVVPAAAFGFRYAVRCRTQIRKEQALEYLAGDLAVPSSLDDHGRIAEVCKLKTALEFCPARIRVSLTKQVARGRTNRDVDAVAAEAV